MYANSRAVVQDASSCNPAVTRTQKTTAAPLPRVVYTSTRPDVPYDPYSKPLAAKDLMLKMVGAPRTPVVTSAAVANGNGFECGREPVALSPKRPQTEYLAHPKNASFVPLEAVLARKGTATANQKDSHSDTLKSAVQFSGNVAPHLRYSWHGLSSQWRKRLSTTRAAASTTAIKSIPNKVSDPLPAKATMIPSCRVGSASSGSESLTKVPRGSCVQDAVAVSDGKQRICVDTNILANANYSNSGFSAKIPGLRQNESNEQKTSNASNKNNRDLRKLGSSDIQIASDRTSNSFFIYRFSTGAVNTTKARKPSQSDEQATTAVSQRTGMASHDSSSEDPHLQISRNHFVCENDGRVTDSLSTDVLKENFRRTPLKVDATKTLQDMTSKLMNGFTGKGFEKVLMELDNEPQKRLTRDQTSKYLILGPRNQLIIGNQNNLKMVMSSNASNARDLSQVARPLLFASSQPYSNISWRMPDEDGKSGKKSFSGGKQMSSSDCHSSSHQTELSANESALQNGDDDDDDDDHRTEPESLDDETCLTDFDSNISDDDFSRGKGNSLDRTQRSSDTVCIRVNGKGPKELHKRTASESPLSGSPSNSSSLPLAASETLPALTESLFSNVPPTINFVLKGQKVEPLPSGLQKLLRWRMSSLTPNIVKQCIARSGFRSTAKSNLWLGTWGKHMKPPGYKTIREYQKINHFPGTFQLGRKDRLWHNLSKMFSRFGKKEFGFFPQTFILPADRANLKIVFDNGKGKQKWIIKPPASSCGVGIQVVQKWSEIPKNRPVIVQRYISRPYLINGTKFDLRIYVYVTNFEPLRIYVYEDGLARFASVRYSNSSKNLYNRYIHLTNYSVNRHNAGYEPNSDEEACQGHKWSLKALWTYLQQQGVDSSAIWLKIKDLIIKTLLSAESMINSMVKANVRRRYSCHELFGFDVLLDEKLKPWIIEVNISPSLHSNSQLDINVKGGMIRDLLNLAGFMLPEKQDVLPNPGPAPDLSSYEPSNDKCIDRRLWTNHKTTDERLKHLYYTQRHSDELALETILDVLTPDDIRILTETIDENNRRGDFIRIFPSPSSQRYQVYFEQQRYYNLLLQVWCNKYQKMESIGISLLELYCRNGINLQNPTYDPKHQWVPPSAESMTATPSASKTRTASPS